MVLYSLNLLKISWRKNSINSWQILYLLCMFSKARPKVLGFFLFVRRSSKVEVDIFSVVFILNSVVQVINSMLRLIIPHKIHRSMQYNCYFVNDFERLISFRTQAGVFYGAMRWSEQSFWLRDQHRILIVQAPSAGWPPKRGWSRQSTG